MRPIPALIAALPREVSGLVKGWERRRLAGGVVVYTNGDAVVAYAGMGAARVTLAVQAAMDVLPVTALLSVGLAGACDPKMRVGEIVHVGLVVDARTGERFGESQSEPVLVSTDAIASVMEKARLHAAYSAAAVDMEAATVARLALARGVAFRAIKAISDEAEFAMAGLERFVTAEGEFREGAFALHAALRPAMWGKVIALGRNSGKAVRALTEALRGELDWYRKRA
jgi:adenosylhomocysteine nucleosidase